MSICHACGQEKKTADSCGGKIIFVGGLPFDRITFGHEHGDRWQEFERCPECGVARGGLHHPGCDLEQCPRCGRQYITCDCVGGSDDVTDTVASALRHAGEEGGRHG